MIRLSKVRATTRGIDCIRGICTGAPAAALGWHPVPVSVPEGVEQPGRVVDERAGDCGVTVAPSCVTIEPAQTLPMDVEPSDIDDLIIDYQQFAVIAAVVLSVATVFDSRTLTLFDSLPGRRGGY